ncbi:hypothetical protein ACFVT9_22525 [Kitasatospora cineracea]|uniref:hypothetical protein n=1 Tax=Kitasatospora TaxID=2063 RepID=UPI0035DBB41A
MPTHSTPLPVVGPRHAAPPGRDRLSAFLTASWAALHLPVIILLGLSAHHQAEAGSPVVATAPDLPVT